jgi:hypothetical protein
MGHKLSVQFSVCLANLGSMRLGEIAVGHPLNQVSLFIFGQQASQRIEY